METAASFFENATFPVVEVGAGILGVVVVVGADPQAAREDEKILDARAVAVATDEAAEETAHVEADDNHSFSANAHAAFTGAFILWKHEISQSSPMLTTAKQP